MTVNLQGARPSDKIHLLVCDTPNKNELTRIGIANNALVVNYRENLLQRIQDGDRFLALHHNLDRELQAIKSICCGVNEKVVLLTDLDCLITYLQVQPASHISLFWRNLEQIRKLEKLLWILLPQQLAHKTWPTQRVKYI